MDKKQSGLSHLRKPISLSGMTKANARVAIAQDVLAALDAEVITPVSGTYGIIKFKEGLEEQENRWLPRFESVRELLGKAEFCHACALGAACFALVGRENKLTARVIDGRANIHEGDFRVQLREYFSRLQIAMIESAYEVADFSHSEDFQEVAANFGGKTLYHPAVPSVHKAIKKAMAFTSLGVSPSVRMRHIFENIVKNKGMFKP